MIRRLHLLALGSTLAFVAVAQGQDVSGDDPFASDRAPATESSGDALAYETIDRATVRIFAGLGVEVEQVRGQHFLRSIAVPVAGHGSGVAVSRDGLVVTAQHVIANAHHLAVRVPGEDAVRPARVLLQDEAMDFALLAVDGVFEHVVPIPAEPRTLVVRETVHAVGYPLDASRRHPQSARGIVSGVLDDGHLQLGMSLNLGNSGGPLIDEHGSLIGIVIARGDPTQGVQGIGIAVPIEPIATAIASARQSLYGRTRAQLTREREALTRAAEALSLLVELDGAELLRELVAIIERNGSDETLRQLQAHATRSNDPDIQLMVAALYWDAAEIAMERAGAFRTPAQMPLGPPRDSATWFREQSLSLVRMAVQAKPVLERENGFVRHVLGAAPAIQARPGWSRASWRRGGEPPPEEEPSGPTWKPKRPFWRLECAMAAGADQPPGVGGGHLGVTLSWPVLSSDERARLRLGLLVGPQLLVGYWEDHVLVHLGPEVGFALRYRARGAGFFAELAYSPGLLAAGGDVAFAHAAYRVRLGFSWYRTVTGVSWLGLGRRNGYAYHALTVFTGRRF